MLQAWWLALYSNRSVITHLFCCPASEQLKNSMHASFIRIVGVGLSVLCVFSCVCVSVLCLCVLWRGLAGSVAGVFRRGRGGNDGSTLYRPALHVPPVQEAARPRLQVHPRWVEPDRQSCHTVAQPHRPESDSLGWLIIIGTSWHHITLVTNLEKSWLECVTMLYPVVHCGKRRPVEVIFSALTCLRLSLRCCHRLNILWSVAMPSDGIVRCFPYGGLIY